MNIFNFFHGLFGWMNTTYTLWGILRPKRMLIWNLRDVRVTDSSAKIRSGCRIFQLGGCRNQCSNLRPFDKFLQSAKTWISHFFFQISFIILTLFKADIHRFFKGILFPCESQNPGRRFLLRICGLQKMKEESAVFRRRF